MSCRLRNESGQALVLTSLFLILIMGATGLTVDVGAWYHERRQAQTTADAAALSGAQQLNTGTAQAQTSAQSYADQNGGGVNPNGITFQSDFAPNDTVSVAVTRTAPGFFSRIFGIDSVQVHATATARSAVPTDVLDAAPIVVKSDHPMLTGAGCGNPTSPPDPCFGSSNQTVIPLGKNGEPGSFAVLDLMAYTQAANGGCPNSSNGNDGSSTVASWITTGFNQFLNLGCYDSDPGAKFNSNNIEDALSGRLGSTLLFPVYDTEAGQGSNATYHVIGWAAYYVTGWAANNGSDSLPGYTCGPGSGVCGYFTQVNWEGIQNSTAPTDPDFGVHTIALVN
ncbi:MAG TPA: pilus assembly protein TadG-related protein [Gaiellaceae bacterium]|jgi:Flp pilus assembly protein TadG